MSFDKSARPIVLLPNARIAAPSSVARVLQESRATPPQQTLKSSERLCVPVLERGEPHPRSLIRKALVIQVVAAMGLAGGQRPSGVGYTYDQPPKYSPLESTAPWSDKNGAATAPSRPKPDRRSRNRIIVATVVIVVVAILISLATVPVAQHKTYTLQGVAAAAGIHGCSPDAVGFQSFPMGKTVQVSWSTVPATPVLITVAETQNGTGVFLGPGASGSGSFYSAGGYYWFTVCNSGSQATSVTISAYYNFQGPIL